MVGFYGADVAQLRSLAQRLAVAADALDSVAREVATTVNAASTWEGPDAVHFRNTWQTRGRSSIQSASSRLRDASASLINNALQQEGASAADSGAGALASNSRLTGVSLPPLFGVDPFMPGFNGEVWRLPGNNGQLPTDVERWLQGWAAPCVEPHAFGFNGRSLIEFHELIGDMGDVIDQETAVFGMTVGDFVEKLPGAEGLGNLIGNLEIVTDPSKSTGEKLLDLGYVTLQDLGAEIRGNAKSPTTFVAGMAVSAWSDALNEARNVDWSADGLSDAYLYAAEDPARLVAPIVEGVTFGISKATDYVGVGWLGDIVTDAAGSADFSPETLDLVGSFVSNNPDVVVQEVGKAIVTVGGQIGDAVVNQFGKKIVGGAIDWLTSW